MTVEEKIAFYRKLTEDRTRWANEAVRNIKRRDTSNIKLGLTFAPGEQYSTKQKDHLDNTEKK